MANVDWGQEVRPSVHDLIAAVNELESYTDVERVDTGTFLTRNVIDGVSGEAEIQEIKGNTAVWNQAVNYTLNHNTTKNGVQMQVFAPDQKVIITGNWEGPYVGDVNYYGMAPDSFSNYQLIAGHKYAVITTFDLFSVYIYFTGGNFGVHQGSYIATAPVTVTGIDATFRPYSTSMPAQTVNEQGYFMMFDLTLMYGAGNEPTTIAEFEAQYGSDFKPYSALRLLDTNIAGINDLAFPQKTLRGIGTAQDDMTNAGIERHIGTIDLGTLNYTREQYDDFYYFASNSVPSRKGGSSNLRCAAYETIEGGRTQLTKTGIASWNAISSPAIAIRNDSYTDAAAFKAAMSGVILEYELATQTFEQFESPIDLTYTVQEGGTETWIVPTGNAPTSTAPTATIQYKMQYNYELITEKSFDNFCDALGTALSLDISKEWNATTKEWDFTITQAASSLSTIRESEVAEIEEPIEWIKGEVKPDENEVETIEPVEETEIIEPEKESVENE